MQGLYIKSVVLKVFGLETSLHLKNYLRASVRKSYTY